MPAKVLPPVDQLRRMVEAGMTHAQIAEQISEKTGYPVATKTVSAALSRAGLVKKKRYENEIPWRVKTEHLYNYHAQMLRALGRRNAGLELSEFAQKRLDSWLQKLEESGLVVVYAPNTADGFFLIQEEPDIPDIPVKRDLPPAPRG